MPLLNDQKWPRAAGRFPKANRTGRLPVTRGDSQGWNDDAGWGADWQLTGRHREIAVITWMTENPIFEVVGPFPDPAVFFGHENGCKGASYQAAEPCPTIMCFTSERKSQG